MTSFKTLSRLESQLSALAGRLDHERTLEEYAKDAQQYERLLRKYYRACIPRSTQMTKLDYILSRFQRNGVRYHD